MKQIVRGIAAVIIGIFVLSVPVTAQVRQDTGITITTPQNGGTIVNTHAQVTGSAPANTIIRVVVADAVPNRPNVKHQPGGQVSGTVTSDDNGQWVYVPSVALVPGQFTAKASYVGEANRTVQSPTVTFVVVDAEGNSAVASVGLERRIAIGLMLLALLLFIYIFFVVRRNGGHFVSREAEKIEHEIEETNEVLGELRDRLLHEEELHRYAVAAPPTIPPSQQPPSSVPPPPPPPQPPVQPGQPLRRDQ